MMIVANYLMISVAIEGAVLGHVSPIAEVLLVLVDRDVFVDGLG